MILKEGGNVFKDAEGNIATQRINRQDVDPTLAWLEKITGVPHQDFKLGTTGIKATSGDLDIAVNQADISKDEMAKKLTAWCQQNNKNPKEWVRKSGISVHFKTPINGDESQGYVQTDLMFGDPAWMKWSLRGAGDDSQYKGVHRHQLLSSIAKAQGMKWSFQNGLMDRETNEIISKNPEEIAKKLFGPDGQADDLESVETIWTRIKDRPDRNELTAGAQETFARDNLTLPENSELTRIKELAGI